MLDTGYTDRAIEVVRAPAIVRPTYRTHEIGFHNAKMCECTVQRFPNTRPFGDSEKQPTRSFRFTARPVGADRWKLRLMADSGIVCSMSRSGNVWDNAAMESFFSSLKTERAARKTYRTRNEARADVFDYIERFYNATRRHSTIGYLSPVEFERKVGLA
jgi:putative transposase